MRKTVCAVMIKDGCLLLVRNRKSSFWTLPGGQPEETETNNECLKRELKEELPHMITSIGNFFGSFCGVTPTHKEFLRAEVFLTQGEGKIAPGAEIARTRWEKNPEKHKLTQVTANIIISLREKNLFPKIAKDKED